MKLFVYQNSGSYEDTDIQVVLAENETHARFLLAAQGRTAGLLESGTSLSRVWYSPTIERTRRPTNERRAKPSANGPSRIQQRDRVTLPGTIHTTETRRTS